MYIYNRDGDNADQIRHAVDKMPITASYILIEM